MSVGQQDSDAVPPGWGMRPVDEASVARTTYEKRLQRFRSFVMADPEVIRRLIKMEIIDAAMLVRQCQLPTR